MSETEANGAPGLNRATPNLNKALSQLQGELPKVTKTKEGEVSGETKDGRRYSYKYGYADLADVTDAVGPLLAKYGLAFHAAPTRDPADRREMILAWSLLHESGEERTGEWPLGPANQKPQSLGSAITYGRRYCLGAATGIVAEDDDDGQSAQREHGSRQSAAEAFEAASPARPRTAANGNGSGQRSRAASGEPATTKDEAWLDDAIASAAALPTAAECRELWRASVAKAKAGEITKADATRVQDLLKARIEDLGREAQHAAALDPEDPWAAKVEALSDGEEAAGALRELKGIFKAGQMDETRANRIFAAIRARFPEAAGEARKAAA